MANFDEFGAQIPDETPVEIPVHVKNLNRSFSAEDVRRMVRVELSRQARELGFDSVEEADDFFVDDDDLEFSSEFEMREEFERLPSGVYAEPQAKPAVVGVGGEPPDPAQPVAVEPVKADES